MNYNEIRQNKHVISRRILFHMKPDAIKKEQVFRDKSLRDIEWFLTFVNEGYALNNKEIVENYLGWLLDVLINVGFKPDICEKLLFSTKIILHEMYSDPNLDNFMDSITMMKHVNMHQAIKVNPLKDWKDKYLDSLLTSNRYKSERIITEIIEEEYDVSDIYLYVLQEAMREVGSMWQSKLISVGVEHYCTEVTQHMIHLVNSKMTKKKSKPYKVLCCGIGDELHELGIRMVSDLFEKEGWNSIFLGSNLPSEEILKYTIDFKPHIVCLSITMASNLVELKRTVTLIKENKQLQDVKVIVGGLPFVLDEKLHLEIEVDGYAKDALEGLEIAYELLGVSTDI